MKRTVRYGTFETNSSSMHSLVYSNIKMDKSDLPVTSDGVVYVYLEQEYNCHGTLTTQLEKLEYLLSYLFVKDGWGYNSDFYQTSDNWYNFDIANSYMGRELLELLQLHDSRIKKVIVRWCCDGPEFDHQSHPAYGDNPMDELVYDKDRTLEYLFSPNVSLEMSRD